MNDAFAFPRFGNGFLNKVDLMSGVVRAGDVVLCAKAVVGIEDAELLRIENLARIILAFIERFGGSLGDHSVQFRSGWSRGKLQNEEVTARSARQAATPDCPAGEVTAGGS